MKRILFISLTFFLLFSCAPTLHEVQKNDCTPEWFSALPTSKDTLWASEVGESQSLNVAMKRAKLNALNSLGQQKEARVNGLIKDFEEEVGSLDEPTINKLTSIAQEVVYSVKLTGAKLIKRKFCEKGKMHVCYVLMAYPIQNDRQEFMRKLKKNKELWTRFRAKKAFDELNEKTR